MTALQQPRNASALRAFPAVKKHTLLLHIHVFHRPAPWLGCRGRLDEQAMLRLPAPAAPASAAPDVASLAAQFRNRHDELQRSLDRLQEAVVAKPGAQDTHRLLVDAVEVRGPRD